MAKEALCRRCGRHILKGPYFWKRVIRHIESCGFTCFIFNSHTLTKRGTN